MRSIRSARYALIAATLIVAPVLGVATANAASGTTGHVRSAITVADTPWGARAAITPNDTPWG